MHLLPSISHAHNHSHPVLLVTANKHAVPLLAGIQGTFVLVNDKGVGVSMLEKAGIRF